MCSPVRVRLGSSGLEIKGIAFARGYEVWLQLHEGGETKCANQAKNSGLVNGVAWPIGAIALRKKKGA